MKILFVDDEQIVLESILSGIDFSQIEIDQVHIAQSAEEAMDLLSITPVDIVVTDIEMGDVSGIELMQWLQHQRPETVSMFCTAYSNFDYAKKAIELHAFAYYLKPISYNELKEKLRLAVEEVKKRRVQQEISLYGQYWIDFQPENRNNFWEKFLRQDTRSDITQMQQETTRYRVPYTVDDLFTLLVFDLYQLNRQGSWSPALLNFCMDNVLRELFFSNMLTVEAVHVIQAGVYRVVFHHTSSEIIDKEWLKEHCHKFIDFCNDHLGCQADCYYYTDCSLTSVWMGMEKISKIFRDDLTGNNQIYDAKQYHLRESRYISKETLERLQQILLKDGAETFMEKFSALLSEYRKKGILSRRLLQMLRLDLERLIYTAMWEKRLNLPSASVSPHIRKLAEHSVNSAEDMNAYAEELLSPVKEHFPSVNAPRSTIQRVTEYIDTHLGDELSRNELAKIAYLNVDYLAQLFKEQTGCSMGSYIRNRRIEEARRLLLTTDIPISVIAHQVGYDNLSYFSNMFHNHTGMSPGEFRRKGGMD